MTFDESKQSSEVVIDDVIWTCLMRCELRTDPSVKARFVAKHGENEAWVGFAAGPLST